MDDLDVAPSRRAARPACSFTGPSIEGICRIGKEIPRDLKKNISADILILNTKLILLNSFPKRTNLKMTSTEGPEKNFTV